MNTGLLMLLAAALSGVLVWLLRSARLAQQVALRQRAEDQQSAAAQQLEQQQAHNAQAQGALTEWQARAAQLQAQLASSQATLAAERSASAEKLSLLERTGELMRVQFKTLSQEILEEKTKAFTETNKLNMEAVLTPLRERLSGFEKQVKDSYELETRDRVALKEQIGQLAQLNKQVSAEANSLATALRGQNKSQGAWGELILERIFELSGLEKGREYFIQFSTYNEQGQRFRPDAVVKLPGGRDIVVDAKVSLTAYTRIAECVDDASRARAVAEHVASIRSHLKQLSAKDYHALDDIATLDFVLMFVASEAAYIEAVRAAPELTEEAFGKNIAIVCPTTLLPTLRTISHEWKTEKRNLNASAIAEEAGKLYTQFVAFEATLSEVGKHLGKAQDAYDDARKRLIDGRGNLVRKTQLLKDMGAKSDKELPGRLVQDALGDDA